MCVDISKKSGCTVAPLEKSAHKFIIVEKITYNEIVRYANCVSLTHGTRDRCSSQTAKEK